MRSNASTKRSPSAPLTIAGVLVALAVFAAAFRCDAAQGVPPGEYEVKAAFLFNMIKFVEWPGGPRGPGGAINLCILGTVPDDAALDELDGLEAAGKRIAVRHASSEDDLSGCDVLFIAGTEKRRLSRILDALADSSVLTIGDTEGFARDGVLVNFYLERKKVRFEVNVEAVRRTGLRLSSQLLRLAGAVYGKSPAGE